MNHDRTFFDKPKEPIPLFIFKDGVYVQVKSKSSIVGEGEVGIVCCGECGHIYASDDAARKCCLQNYCACGEKIHQYWTMCSGCSSKKRVDSAELVEYIDGPVCVFDGDEYFSSLEDFYDSYENRPLDEWPDYLNPCETIPWDGIDIIDLIENSLLDEAYEDAHENLVDVDELLAAYKKWYEKQSIISWHPDTKKKIKVIIPQEKLDDEKENV